jgi:CheY-like chemotaxis protein
VLNLVGNAIKFRHTGEVVLVVEVDYQERDSQVIRVTVRDTGIGIPPERQASIFEPFTQVDSSTTRKYGGTGLGLTISSRIVSMMGGTIWFESELGRGTEFHFTARFKLLANQVAPDIKMSGDVLRGIKVLIVDDNATNRKILQSMLVSWDIRPGEADSGPRALTELISAQSDGDPYRLLLCDRHMPAMDGLELVEQARRIPALANLPVLMLTPASHLGEMERWKSLSISSCLVKPVRKVELLASLLRVAGANHAVPPSTVVEFSSSVRRERVFISCWLRITA